MDHRATAIFTNPLAERFQHGIIRFLAAEPFHTLPANYSQIRTPASCLLERINECCLPDPRLPGDENDLSLPQQRFTKRVPQSCQRTFPANDLLCRSRRRTRGSGGNFLMHRRNELISAPRKRCDKDGLVALVAQDLTYFQHVFLDYFRIYVSLRPQFFQYLVLRDEPIRVLHQKPQDVERLGRQRHTFLPTPQTVVYSVESKARNDFMSGEPSSPHQVRARCAKRCRPVYGSNQSLRQPTPLCRTVDSAMHSSAIRSTSSL